MAFPYTQVILRIVSEHGGEIDQETLIEHLGKYVPREDALRCREQGRRIKATEMTKAKAIPDAAAERAGQRRLCHCRLGRVIKDGHLVRVYRPRTHPKNPLIRLGPKASVAPRRMPKNAYDERRGKAARDRVRKVLPQVRGLANGLARNLFLEGAADVSASEYAEWASEVETTIRDLKSFIASMGKEGRA